MSHWQHCVQFNRSEIRTSDLPLQRRTRNRSSNCPVPTLFHNCWKFVLKTSFSGFKIKLDLLNIVHSVLSFRSGVGNLRPAKAFYPARDLLLSSVPRPFTTNRPATFFFFQWWICSNKPQKWFSSLGKNLFCGLRHRVVWKQVSISGKDLFSFFLSLPSIWRKKGLNFWRRPFFFGPLEWWHPAGTLLWLNVAH